MILNIKMLLTVALTLVTSFGYSQGVDSLFNTGTTSTEGKSKKPTVIDSDEMKMDMSKNLSLFIGNVVVESETLEIKCERMELYMEDNIVDGKTKRELRTIICYKNRDGSDDVIGDKDNRVLIIRTENGTPQRSISGKVVYDMKTGEIVMTDKPVLIQDINEIHGSKITIWRDSEEMNVVDGHIRMIDQKL